MTVCLTMIVKDESAVIRRCLEHALPLIDSWCIVDTGSTDGTQGLIVAALGSKPGDLISRSWVSFAHNRTELMALAKDRADWLLVTDADSTFSGSIPADLDRSCVAHEIRYEGAHYWWQPLLVRADLNWAYIGPVHEYLQCLDPGDHVIGRLETLRITHHADSHANVNPQEKFLGHYRLLRDHLAAHPDDVRNTFYMAQTCKDLIPYQAFRRGEAIRLYKRRAAMGGWDEEAFYARFMAGVLLSIGDIEAATLELLQAWEMRPSRAEPLFYLGHALRNAGSPALGAMFLERAARIPRPNDRLFIHEEAYNVGASRGTPGADPSAEAELPAVLTGDALAPAAPDGHSMNGAGHGVESSQPEAAA